MSQQISEQSCIQALELAEQRIGHEPTIEEYDQEGLVPSSDTIQRVCGSWNEAKKKAGMEQNLKNRARIPKQNREQYTKEDCIKAVAYANKQTNYLNLTQGIYKEVRLEHHPSIDTVRRKLGTFPEIREHIL